MNKWIWRLLIAAIVLFGLGVLGKKQGWWGQGKLPEVTLAEVVLGDITEKVNASGRVQPEVEVKISADVSGEIVELPVKEGDSVSVGQLLVKIRPDNYQSLYERALASLNSARAGYSQSKAAEAQSEARLARLKLDYDRQKKLYEQKVIADADYEQARMQYEVGKSELEAARQNVEAALFNIKNAEAGVKDAAENLRKTAIYAPMSGIVSKLNMERGERVVGTLQMTGTEIMRIANLRNMEVVVEVNENDIVRVHKGDSADIEVDSYTAVEKVFKGSVTSIANSAKDAVSMETVTEFEVKVAIDPSSYADLVDKKTKRPPFRPGMTATLEIITQRKKDVLMVPVSAVGVRNIKKADTNKKPQEEQDIDGGEAEAKRIGETGKDRKEVVFVYKDGTVEQREVKTGISDFDNIEIISGLKKGEKVVSGPYMLVSKSLEDQDKVQVKNEKPEKGK
jgi:HlyD family secretion protein